MEKIQTLMKKISTKSSSTVKNNKCVNEQFIDTSVEKIKVELGEKNLELKNLKDSLAEILEQNAMEIQDLNNKLNVAQYERVKEHNVWMEMVRELQKLLFEERCMKDSLEKQLNDLKMQHKASEQEKSESNCKCSIKLESEEDLESKDEPQNID